jgi:hypothetical protein
MLFLLLLNTYVFSSLLMLNLRSTIRQLNIVIGVMPWLKRLKPLKKIILGLLLICLLANIPLVVNECIKLSIRLMVA